ncbi:hypothetical protein DSO57_1028169 [Entomophthora muscae]|uniref:Uncharacterized protein n=1 Tax=Entomophthora muscae TaxID=34485 RepID=A0ACC2TCJ5_9FUNG|nr:hypothetical protein DSO57_1028169 [Entomophthora muscae]
MFNHPAFTFALAATSTLVTATPYPASSWLGVDIDASSSKLSQSNNTEEAHRYGLKSDAASTQDRRSPKPSQQGYMEAQRTAYTDAMSHEANPRKVTATPNGFRAPVGFSSASPPKIRQAIVERKLGPHRFQPMLVPRRDVHSPVSKPPPAFVVGYGPTVYTGTFYTAAFPQRPFYPTSYTRVSSPFGYPNQIVYTRS